MSIIAEHLLAGFIFGDHANGEYVYMPAGEVGLDRPLCVFHTREGRQDITLEQAVALVHRLHLEQVKKVEL